ncbi:MAG: VOC family protein [Sulfitobacter sp.]
MTVKRIVANIAAVSMQDTIAFYRDLLDMEIAMDLGWVATMSSQADHPAQLSIIRDDQDTQPHPDLSIEVEDVDVVHQRAVSMGIRIDYPLTDEPWGVRRFFVSDPAGKLLNILAHA